MVEQTVDTEVAQALRPLIISLDYQKHPLASVMFQAGGTRVLCAVGVDDRVPPWMRAQNVAGGWLTAEYQMLPSSTPQRGLREAARGKLAGRTQEIQRLIGRSLRAMIDLKKVGRRTFYVDCDVVDADGGTRCASVSGAAVALEMAVRRLHAAGELADWPLLGRVAAVSVGLVAGQPVLDLCYEEDVEAEVDMNVVMTSDRELVEVQATAEQRSFSRSQMDCLLELAEKGVGLIFDEQENVLSKMER